MWTQGDGILSESIWAPAHARFHWPLSNHSWWGACMWKDATPTHWTGIHVRWAAQYVPLLHKTKAWKYIHIVNTKQAHYISSYWVQWDASPLCTGTQPLTCRQEFMSTNSLHCIPLLLKVTPRVHIQSQPHIRERCITWRRNVFSWYWNESLTRCAGKPHRLISALCSTCSSGSPDLCVPGQNTQQA